MEDCLCVRKEKANDGSAGAKFKGSMGLVQTLNALRLGVIYLPVLLNRSAYGI